MSTIPGNPVMYIDPIQICCRYRLAYKQGFAALRGKEQRDKLELGYKAGPPHTKRPREHPRSRELGGRGKRKVAYE